MDDHSSIFVAGHRGLVGSALVRKLRSAGHDNLLLRTRDELDLRNQAAVERFFSENRVDYAFVAAATVGGIQANATRQADFLYENLIIACNVIHAAASHGTTKLLFLGSSCIYPRLAPQPMREDSLLTGPLEPTNEGYAIAKIAGLKLCEMYQRQYGKRFISAMPTNLYGPGDNFHPLGSHVIPGMMRRFHEAKLAGAPEVVVWGTGTPRREFLHVDDLAEALYLLMQTYEDVQFINVGSGEEHPIAELAEILKRVVGYEGNLAFDTTKPDGTPRKLLDVSRLHALGWKHSRGLEDGLRDTYRWALENGIFSNEPAAASSR
ncbi:MAG TPA: GDP-L-fucose synthase [Thermoanaerobaculia bacterium]|nr:GDP-L-fucose synthase [Thermoanaerobaculia bacterium]